MLDISAKLCITEAYDDLKIGFTASVKLDQEIITLKCNCVMRKIFYFHGPWNLYDKNFNSESFTKFGASPVG